MKSNVGGKPSNLNNYDFDFGINTAGSSNNRIRSLNGSINDSKPKPASSSSSTTTSWNPNKPSWTHQPSPNQAAALQQPSSMVGDIFGKSWGSGGGGAGNRIGIPEKDPNLFGDLLGSALGQQGGKSNVPLKNAAPIAANKNAAYSMGNLADSLPKTSSSVKNNNNTTSNWGGSGEKLGSYPSVNNNNSNKTGNLGGSSMRGGGAPPASTTTTTTKDPFVSLVGFGSKKEPTLNAASKNVNSTSGDYSFGEFQNAAKSTTPSTNNNSMGSHTTSGSKTDSFGAFDIPIQDFNSQKQASSQPQSKSDDDPLGMLFSSPTPGGSQAHESQTFSGVDDWGLGSHFGGDDNATTTELEGLPPPPTGMTASAAKSKGMDNQKQGQHADAIKWLSWAVVLLEKSGDTATNLEVLSCRASCFKEVGEYKKAVADCSKVLEHEPENVSVLVQRALLYESTEKYKLGAEDLRAVLKIDPGNRLARSTIHRLTQLAD